MKKELSFSETMKGYINNCSRSITLPADIKEFPFEENASDNFTITVTIDDLDKFYNDPLLTAQVSGTINLSWLSPNTITIEQGEFNLFTRPEASSEFKTRKEMHYLLYFKDCNNTPFTLFGTKTISKESPLDLWQETTTLYTYIWSGHHPFKEGESRELHGIGILKISLTDFIHQLTTFKTNAENSVEHLSIITRFLSTFAENIWEAYAPTIFGEDGKRWDDHPVPLRTLDGVRGCEKHTIGFNTKDNLYLELKRFKKNDTKDIVLLLHGLTISTDMFIMPEHYNLTQYLLDNGMEDVWSLDWRGSGYFTYNMEPHRYTIDHMAKYDVPAALQQIKSRVGDDVKIHVIAHCFGSLSFMTSLAAGLTSNIASIISSSVSLTPKVRWQTYLKLLFAPNFVEYILGYPYMSPKMPYYPGPGFGKWLYWLLDLFHNECEEASCHMMSFMWGFGFPAAYKHENLSPITHRRLADLFGGTSMHFYRHILKMIKAGAAVPYSRKKEFSDLPANYLENVKNITLPPTLFVSGKENHIFPESNKHTYQELLKQNASYPIEYMEFAGYGHQDVFMGKNAAQDIFPHFIKFINQHK